MELKEEENIVTLLAVRKAYNYFLPRLNNVKEMQILNNKAEPEQEESVKELDHTSSEVRKKTYDKKRLSFVRFLKLDRVEPHCDCEKDDQGRCTRMQNWLEVSKSNELGLKKIYRELINIVEYIVRMEGDDIIEIDLTDDGVVNRIFTNRVMNSIYMDVCRTYPSIPYFKLEGKSYLSKILLIYSLMDIDVGYVQGMNFLVGCILWHSSSEEQAFELLVSLMFNYGMRDMFVSGLPGLRVKCRILDQLMEKELYLIWDHIIKQGGTIDMLATDWFLTLFSYSIPLNIIGKFWDDFFQQGWVPLYKLILYRLQRIESNILHSNDIADIMNAIKYSTPTTKNGIFGNAFLNFKDELGKSNVVRFFNHFNSLFSNNTISSNDQTGHEFGFSNSDIIQNSENNGSNTETNVNSSSLTNDPNIISLPYVWSELITESQYEIDLDVDYIQEMELKYSSGPDKCLEFFKNNNYKAQATHTNSGELNMQSFEYFLDDDEIKEKEEQDEEQPISNNTISDSQRDNFKSTNLLNSSKNSSESEQDQVSQSLETNCTQETDIKDQIISRYREYYRGIMESIFQQSDQSYQPKYSTPATNHTKTISHPDNNTNHVDKSTKQSISKSIYEVKDKLESSLERLLSITEILLIKNINKQHLKELSIKCKEIQKNKFGPWSYHQ
ncbi:TBC domain-containing protein [Cryptosporidium ubiquitum]|uniref:TBC domain-containing protein n=1 Tax=Cryptosporidium ubiquitum TaxID=857276 RepID=A0A1J4MGF4_9CRYT|nr:TBC domain-containing protein [Cryptosporidium ubiquitum]OII71941.1 TBC domain-containing protein [Cryptosporidium ubiquitum]